MVAEMSTISKSFTLILILLMAVSSLIVVKTVPIGVAQSGTNVSGIISSNITWSQSGSPYNVTGDLTVPSGVTLAIDQGVELDLNGHNIQVEGTLRAIGNVGQGTINVYTNAPNNNGGSIFFSDSSTSWNSQNGLGSIISNVHAYEELVITVN